MLGCPSGGVHPAISLALLRGRARGRQVTVLSLAPRVTCPPSSLLPVKPPPHPPQLPFSSSNIPSSPPGPPQPLPPLTPHPEHSAPWQSKAGLVSSSLSPCPLQELKHRGRIPQPVGSRGAEEALDLLPPVLQLLPG